LFCPPGDASTASLNLHRNCLQEEAEDLITSGVMTPGLQVKVTGVASHPGERLPVQV
jgi:hypothetical protein